ncbi:hypothetical protein [Kyrpidia tusciae]|uniref:hypothetical protein n=1 Tax=Kyrpidia tusciae TaxID=33943 RepID=UPI000F4E088C|nr:hypothetical protein [Kyrpidia tusciae]
MERYKSLSPYEAKRAILRDRIAALVAGIYFKACKKGGKKYFLISLILTPVALIVGLVPGLLVVFLVPH